mmetsp:Transcript_79751/g.207261  ORF Transcript_79751/g.207261 Transcript_79751/m.207261 type:complete len:564 (-) Transcript_79751:120-1811(-)|eukprot:CAMPEP_0115312850 /NCGR_PEP_ID=MMETSP0270-20121206/76131_1 /TAXON_ID=71861 /ORGANISM="Scrippsiella trochoidea, Strain CCMP3099" /LENGTH=563 /DNA_ID=CAMNT_0002731861 /DNA_START=51 /DNA_END=1742 /DNA_ORIENTATION=+
MIDYDEGGCIIFLLMRFKGSVIPRALLFALPTAALTAILVVLESDFADLTDRLGLAEIRSSQVYTASTGAILVLLGFRTKQAMSRFWEGTSLLHQMRGEWFDSVSCLMTFSRGAVNNKPREVAEFRHTLVRLMSLCHGSALEEIKSEGSDEFEVIDIQGLDPHTLLYLDESKCEHGFNRVEVLLHMIQVLVTQNLDDGVLKVAPPILSRVYQTLSRGLVNLLNATKIKNTRFPFPYAQLIAVFMLLHTVWTPFMIAALVKEPLWAALIAFLPVFGMFSINFVATQLEMPFGQDDNDLPLAHFQHEMNKGLLMLLHPSSDMLAKTSPMCILDYAELQTSFISKGSVGVSSLGVAAAHSTASSSARKRSRDTMFREAAILAEGKEHEEENGELTEDGGDGREALEHDDEAVVQHFVSRTVRKSKQDHPMLPQPLSGNGHDKDTLLGASVLMSASPPDLLLYHPGDDMHPLPQDLDTAMQTWLRRTNDQLEALRANTQVISKFTEAFPALLSSLGNSATENGVVIDAPGWRSDDQTQQAGNIFAYPLSCNSCAEEGGNSGKGRRLG